eukprot:XP_001701271.1 predicted protein [Chlamydomonas reinhardtii]
MSDSQPGTDPRQSQQQGVEASRAVTSATPDAPEPVVERVSNSSGSRKAFAKAFTSLLGLQLAKPEDLDPDTLRNPPFPRYTPALSELSVQQLRPYFLNRTYTDTDVSYLTSWRARELLGRDRQRRPDVGEGMRAAVHIGKRASYPQHVGILHGLGFSSRPPADAGGRYHCWARRQQHYCHPLRGSS